MNVCSAGNLPAEVGNARDAAATKSRLQIDVRGIVQGVGFRPFVYNLAKKLQLNGFVFNDSLGVHIEIEGSDSTVREFLLLLEKDAPPLARLESLSLQEISSPANFIDFQIQKSESANDKFVLLSPDIAICEECLRELFDPSNRRYRYPFINCTNCGPRYTIVEDVPYDRKNTTMKSFPMCTDCEMEYHNPSDRRFHAQPNACPVCGPQLSMTDEMGEQALTLAIHQLREGKIVAIKGLGGYHLACDARNEKAVQLLRGRKYREDKPFAIMAREAQDVAEFCVISDKERELLTSGKRPIVLLRKKEDCSLPRSLAPGLRFLGWMLSYTPLHHLLMKDFGGPLVMTSGNVSDEPIAYQDADAQERLFSIADSYLTHDRQIQTRCDDSVIRVVRDQEYLIRRSRGYAPDPIVFSNDFQQQVLACGAELKNTFCLTRGKYAFLSHHIGDLENLETLNSFTSGIEHFKNLFDLNPTVIAHDLHPDYLSTKYAMDQSLITKRIGVQHHHAHIASCMAENDLNGDVIGVAMDGLGYGTDGNFWGGEFLIANYHRFERVAHLEYMAMPGGAAAIKEPWRMAGSYLHSVFGNELPDFLLERKGAHAYEMIQKMIIQKINSPVTSSMGRCFDAVASLLGLRDRINYEGEAAIELEMIADERCQERYDFPLNEHENTIRISALITGIVRDLITKVPPEIISAKFHNSIVDLIVRLCVRMKQQHQLDRVALSGGVFQNMFLLDRVLTKLSEQEFLVYIHHRIPTNDGGISLGQAVIANARCKDAITEE